MTEFSFFQDKVELRKPHQEYNPIQMTQNTMFLVFFLFLLLFILVLY